MYNPQILKVPIYFIFPHLINRFIKTRLQNNSQLAAMVSPQLYFVVVVPMGTNIQGWVLKRILG